MDFKELRKLSRKRRSKSPQAETLAEAPAEAPADVLAVPPVVLREEMPIEPLPQPQHEPDDGESLFDFFGETELELSQRTEILRFRLNSEYFALYLTETEEIIKPRGFTVVPRMPPWILGIVSLRGTMVPVVDLARRLNIAAEASPTQRIIIINHNGELCGLQVDEVKNVEIIDPDLVEQIPAALHETAGKFLNGLIRINGDLIAMIDVEAVLNLALEGQTRERAA